MYKISPSRIFLFISCPRCFFLEVKKDIKRPIEFFPGLPSALDKIFKEVAESFREKDLPEYLKKLGLKGRLRKISLKETKIKGTNLYLRGIPDEIIENEKSEFLPLDYKTSSKIPQKLPLPVQIQIDAYSYLMSLNNLNIADKGYVIYFVPYYSHERKRIKWNIKLFEHEIKIKRLKKFIIEMDKVLNSNEPPPPAKSCPFCNFVEKTKVFF